MNDLFHRLRQDQQGATAVIFALVFIPIAFVVGSAIDYSRASLAKTQLQVALDAAVVRSARHWDLADAEVRARAEDIIGSIFAAPFSITAFQRDTLNRTISITAKSDVETTFMRLARIDAVEVASHAQITVPQQYIQIAMSLDNSGSMTGTRMPNLIAAGKLLVDTLTPFSIDNKLEYGLVPFGQLVNVGAQYKTATWIDSGGLAPSHFAHLDPPLGPVLPRKTRIEVIESMKDESGAALAWGGCVEARTNGYDVTDDAPSTLRPETLFVPSFAPDEPGPPWGGLAADRPPTASQATPVANSYMDDDGGTCLVSLPAKDAVTLALRQNRSCKYAGKTAYTTKSSVVSSGVPLGPNFQCTTPALTRLTTDGEKIKSALDLMRPLGGTNIGEGLAWGWRLLSRNAPFADGMPAGTKNGRRIAILMTDGENWLDQVANINGSMYGAYGFYNDGRLSGGSGSNVGMIPMNNKLIDICTSMKAQKIEIFTVGLSIPTNAAKQLLTDCSSNGQAYMISDAAELTTVFRSIAKSILQPYLSQ